MIAAWRPSYRISPDSSNLVDATFSSSGRHSFRRVGELYLPPGARYFGCRHCHRLTYKTRKRHTGRNGCFPGLGSMVNLRGWSVPAGNSDPSRCGRGGDGRNGRREGSGDGSRNSPSVVGGFGKLTRQSMGQTGLAAYPFLECGALQRSQNDSVSATVRSFSRFEA